MTTYVLLDSGPLGLATNPRHSEETRTCIYWIEGLLRRGVRVVVPEIADYEVRRELLRGEKREGLRRLDKLKSAIGYVPITTESMLRAAQFWADCRNKGVPTTDDKSLDADVILAGQAATLEDEDDEAIVATTNVGHLSRFVSAKNWQDIS